MRPALGPALLLSGACLWIYLLYGATLGRSFTESYVDSTTTSHVVVPSFARRVAAQHADRCVNPYNEEGLLYFPGSTDLLNTTYVTFSSLLDSDISSVSVENYPDAMLRGQRAFPNRPLPQALIDAAPHNWLKDLMLLKEATASKQLAKYPEVVERTNWLRNRTILLVGDSIDRSMSAFLCQRNLGGENGMGPYGFQTTTRCHVPFLNFTLIGWHIASLYDTKPTWWWKKDMEIVDFEHRWEKYFLPSLIADNGARVHIDLAVVQSGMWDHGAFVTSRLAEYAAKNGGNMNAPPGPKNFKRSLNFLELRFFINRFRTLLQRVLDDLPDTPVACRALTERSLGDENTAMHQLDRAQAYACKTLDVETIPFSTNIFGIFGTGNLLIDAIHYDNGPISALWSNMILYYLYRTQGGLDINGTLSLDVGAPTGMPAWSRCHDYFMQNYPS
ncbi:uncharacterized protein V1518DRAFT_375510 [Limtongia smithiae]|uniref:uncharacterized protein n=1 Tax=Limtongia smithiae TaxID=1125753 RepID=UPI0034CE490A